MKKEKGKKLSVMKKKKKRNGSLIVLQIFAGV